MTRFLRGLQRHRGLGLALVVVSLTVSFQYQRLRGPAEDSSNRFDLPAFDPFVYVVMAEQPQFFTVAPWGYRILTPWIVRWISGRTPIPGYRQVTLVALVAAGALLFLFLRRLGHGEGPSLIAVAAFGLCGPVAESIRAPFLGEPVAVALEIAFLLAIECGAATSVLCLIAVLLAFSKEVFVLFVPLVYLARRPAAGRWPAFRAALLVAVPPLVVSQTLRIWWTPHLSTPHPALTLALAGDALRELGATWDGTWPGLLLGGLTPLAIVGALRATARPFLVRYGYLLAATVVLSFVAWLNIPSEHPHPYFEDNVVRLLVYAVPLVLPLALLAVDRVWPHFQAPPAATAPRAVWGWLAAAAVAACVAFPFAALDRYRRLPLHAHRDGPFIATLCRESLKAARRVDNEWFMSWDLAERVFIPDRTDPRDLQRMRWFLQEGWGADPQYRRGASRMDGREATLLLPSFSARDQELVLTLSGVRAEPLDVLVNGTRIGRVQVDPSATDHTLHIPGALLFRGDNVLALQRPDASRPGPRLHRWQIRAAW